MGENGREDNKAAQSDEMLELHLMALSWRKHMVAAHTHSCSSKPSSGTEIVRALPDFPQPAAGYHDQYELWTTPENTDPIRLHGSRSPTDLHAWGADHVEGPRHAEDKLDDFVEALVSDTPGTVDEEDQVGLGTRADCTDDVK